MFLRKNCRLSGCPFFIRGMTVQLDWRPLFRMACTGRSQAGRSDQRPRARQAPWPLRTPRPPGPAGTHLQQGVGADLQHHGVLGHVAQGLLEQHGAHQVVHVVLGRAGAGQAALPLGLGDGRAEPARGAGLRLPDHLRTGPAGSGRALGRPPGGPVGRGPTFLSVCSNVGAMACMKWEWKAKPAVCTSLANTLSCFSWATNWATAA